MGRALYLNNPDFSTANAVTVYTRSSWSSAWTARPYVRVIEATKTLGTAISTARVFYDYGEIMQHDLATFSTYAPLSIRDHWIKIEWNPDAGNANYDFAVADATARLALTGMAVDQKVLQSDTGTIYQFDGPLGSETLPGSWTALVDSPTVNLETWYGIVTDETISEHDSDGTPGGTQAFQCHGLEWLLQRQQITESVVDDPGGTTMTIPMGLPFNGFRGDNRTGELYFGNKDAVFNYFASDMRTAGDWNAEECIEYLLDYFAPVDSGPMVFEIDSGSAGTATWHNPQAIETHGQTIFNIINAILPRERGLCWWLTVDEDNDKVLLHIDTLTESNISLPSAGGTVFANRSLVDVYYDNEANNNALLTVSSQRQFEQVVVEGAKRGAVVTLGLGQGTLEEDWSASDQTAYITAATADGDYGNLYNQSDKNAVNDQKRATDPKLSRVFTTFKVPAAWDGLVGSGASGATDRICLHELEPDADHVSPDATADFWWAGVKVESYMPIYEGHDYDDPDSPTSYLPSDSVKQFMRPFAVVKVKAPPATVARDIYEMVDNLGSQALSEDGATSGIEFNCSLAPYDNQPGIQVRPSTVPHAMASGVTVTNSNHDPGVDYETLRATVYLTFADRIRTEYPVVLPSERHNHISKLLIRLGELAHADYMPQDTIWSVSSGKLVLTSSAGYVRDDRQQMRELGAMAYAWYQTARSALDLTINHVSSTVQVGQLIETVRGSTTVNSVVSMVKWDFRNQQTTYATEYAELDFRSFYRA